MQRLTQKDLQGNWNLKGVPWENLYIGQPITKELRDKLYGALWKLMEYEDTGLSPEEVQRMADKKAQEYIFECPRCGYAQRFHNPIIEHHCPFHPEVKMRLIRVAETE